MAAYLCATYNRQVGLAAIAGRFGDGDLVAPDVLATARAQRWDPAEVVRVLPNEEVVGRDSATRRSRCKTANFPTGKTLGSWRPEESSISEATQNAPITLEWIGRHENLVVSGPSGTGNHTSSKAWPPRQSSRTCESRGSRWKR